MQREKKEGRPRSRNRGGVVRRGNLPKQLKKRKVNPASREKRGHQKREELDPNEGRPELSRQKEEALKQRRAGSESTRSKEEEAGFHLSESNVSIILLKKGYSERR